MTRLPTAGPAPRRANPQAAEGMRFVVTIRQRPPRWRGGVIFQDAGAPKILPGAGNQALRDGFAEEDDWNGAQREC